MTNFPQLNGLGMNPPLLSVDYCILALRLTGTLFQGELAHPEGAGSCIRDSQ